MTPPPEFAETDLLALARARGLPAWAPGELFHPRPVPMWVAVAIGRLMDAGRLVREVSGPCRWKYREVRPAAQEPWEPAVTDGPDKPSSPNGGSTSR